MKKNNIYDEFTFFQFGLEFWLLHKETGIAQLVKVNSLSNINEKELRKIKKECIKFRNNKSTFNEKTLSEIRAKATEILLS